MKKMQDSLEDYLRLTKNSKQDGSIQMSKEMVVTAQLKKECDTRAMKIVEFSIEGKLRPEVFTRCLPFINQSYYQDIVEERAITKLCGYSVCGKRIPEMPKKQYFISTKSNKVYDITDRKNFCSNFCYKASLHIKKQIDNSPLWLRKLEDIPEYNLLHCASGGLPGEYIDQGIVKPAQDEMQFTSINSFAEASLGDLTESKNLGKQNTKKAGFKKSSRLKTTMQTIKETEVEEEISVNETLKTTKRIDPKSSAQKLAKKEPHKRNCVVSLPSIEENEERPKENDCSKKSNVIEQGDEKENNNEEEKLKKIKQERLEDVPPEPVSDSQPQVLSENTTVITASNVQIIEQNKQTKPDEISIKSEPPEKENKKCLENAKIPRKSVKRRQANTSSPKVLDVETTIKKALDDWITLETCIFIHGEQKVKHILNEKKLSDWFEKLHVQELQREQQIRYMDICRRLQLQEMADEKFDKALVGGQKLKPLPDFRRLKEQTKELKIKVKAFYEGSMYEEDSKINSQPDEVSEEGPPAVLPPVDVHSQNLLRRKIFMNSLSKAIQQLLVSLGASYSAVLSDVQALVKTFHLKADNIVFKPLVWNYIAFVLLDLLSLRDYSLRDLLEEPRSQEYIHILFEPLPNKRKFVEDVLRNVKNVELFVERYITKVDGQ